MQQIFFGPLRPLEQERLYDRLWFFLTESLLAFTIFRDEFDAVFGFMFGFLLFVKCFHWLMSDRIEWMDQVPYPGPGTLFQIRFLALFSLLSFTDFVMLAFAVETIALHGVGGIVLFGNEYAIMLANAFNCLSKYVVFSYDQRRARRNGGENAPVWEQKSMYLFYIELVTDFLKLVTYLTFFVLVLAFYGLPLNFVRDVYLTARSFYQRCRDLVRYLDATKNMDQRYPDATQAELDEMSDKTCIICREDLSLQNTSSDGVGQAQGHGGRNQGPNMSPKKLLCGHIFHFHCLRSWLERQQSCPTCRRSVLESSGISQTRPAQPAAPVNNEAAPGPVANREVPMAQATPLGARAGDIPSTNGDQRSAQRTRRHRWANQLSGFRAEPLRPPLRFEGFNVGPGDWQRWETSSDEDTVDSQTPEPSSSRDNAPASPRQAAALAALRRIGGESNSRDTLERQTMEPSPSTTSPTSETSRSFGKAPLSEQRIASQARSRELGIPSMIPLYDPAIQPLSPNSHSSRLTSSSPAITRDSIDERLRALSDVQNALWKSAEELLKLKSLLPLANPPSSGQTATSVPISKQPSSGYGASNVDIDSDSEDDS